MRTVPNPAAALRLMIDAAKQLDPALTDSAVANALGVTLPALSGWLDENEDKRKTPAARNRMAIGRWVSGLVSALPQAFAAEEAADVAAKVVPFGTKAAS